MTRVEAVIRPAKLDDVKEALDQLGVKGITVENVMGAGKQRGRSQYYRGQEYVVNLLDKVKVETVVSDDMVDSVIQAITQAAFTGEIGDGKIFVTNVADVIRIRTGERGEISDLRDPDRSKLTACRVQGHFACLTARETSRQLLLNKCEMTRKRAGNKLETYTL